MCTRVRMPPMRKGRRMGLGTPAMAAETGSFATVEDDECEEVQSNQPWIANVDCCIRNNPVSLMEVACSTHDWERVALKIDSGAVDTVMPPTVAQYFPLKKPKGPRLEQGTWQQTIP